MIAFHFPPSADGSGHLRTLGMVRHLPALGWKPVVLSAGAMAYPWVDPDTRSSIPAGCAVHRAFALDAQRHFGIAGKYPAFMAKPDRWASWWPAAVWSGLQLIRRYRIDALWSTYPIMTAHVIAASLSRRTGLPWIADFRDPVATSVSRRHAFARESQRRHECNALSRAARVVLTTSGAMRYYAEQYPKAFGAGRLNVIPNGYEESAFADLPQIAPREPDRPLRFVHSGTLYPEGRNPMALLSALASLKEKGALTDKDIHVVFRASRNEVAYTRELQRLRIENLVTFAPPVSNREALREQAEADALLLLQGDQFAGQIPAKVYEYLRIGRPILALVGEHGDTRELLQQTGGAELVDADDAAAIEQRLPAFMRAVRQETWPVANAAMVRGFSRCSGAARLAGLLDEVVMHAPR